MLESFEAEHGPTTPTEEALVVQLALANWRLRRLYHQEAGLYTYQIKSLADIGKDLKLDDAGQMARAAGWNEKTLDLFNRQEGRLERTFYRALHELQRLRKEREANLALVCPEPLEEPVGQVPDLPSSETNNMNNQAPPNPSTDSAPTQETGIHIVPEAV